MPDEGPLTNILTNISGEMGQNGSRFGEIEPLEKTAQTALNAASRLELSLSGDSETLVEVAGIEPAGAGGSTPANKRDSAHSREALIKILTNLPDSDRRMLSRVVARWGDLICSFHPSSFCPLCPSCFCPFSPSFCCPFLSSCWLPS